MLFSEGQHFWMVVWQFFDIRMIGIIWLATRPRAVNTAVWSSSHKHYYFRLPSLCRLCDR